MYFLCASFATMNRNISRFLRMLVLGTTPILALASPTTAQEPHLNSLASALVEPIASRKVHSVVVADFLTPLGTESQAGKYLANKLCEAWAQNNQKFKVTEREQLTATLNQQKATAKDLDDVKFLKKLRGRLDADAIVIGTLDVLENLFMLSISVRKVADGALLARGELSFPRSGVLESLTQGSPRPSLDGLPRAGLNGVGAPQCEFCPEPEFPSKARVAKISQASVFLDIVVTPQGTSTGVKILKDPGYGFAEMAIEALRGWRFRPAVDKDKNPIAARVQIEFAFH